MAKTSRKKKRITDAEIAERGVTDADVAGTLDAIDGQHSEEVSKKLVSRGHSGVTSPARGKDRLTKALADTLNASSVNTTTITIADVAACLQSLKKSGRADLSAILTDNTLSQLVEAFNLESALRRCEHAFKVDNLSGLMPSEAMKAINRLLRDNVGEYADADNDDKQEKIESLREAAYALGADFHVAAKGMSGRLTGDLKGDGRKRFVVEHVGGKSKITVNLGLPDMQLSN